MKKFNLLKGFMLSLLTLALCFVAFGAVKAKADGDLNAVYQPDTDTIKVTSTSAAITKVYYIDLGKSGKQKIKENNVKELPLSGEPTSLSGEIVLDSKDDGLKASETKDIYLYYSAIDPTTVVDKDDKIVGQTANLTVKKTTTKKFTVTLNYASADSGQDVGIAFTAADDKGKAIDVDEKVIFRYSEDGKEFGPWKPADELTPDVLYKAIAATDGGKPTFEFKVKGTDSVRDSKAVKVKVAKAGKAPKIKVDYLKGTAALKNGFDYHVSSSSAAPTSLSGWITILPTNKLGTAAGAAVYKATADVVPCAKPSSADEKAMYAKSTEKVKSVPVSKLFDDAKETDAEAYEEGSIYLYVRKSATAKKPASAISETAIEIKAVATAPEFTSSISGEYDDKKKTWTFEFSSNSGDIEYLIFDSASAASGEHSDAKWVKLGNKGLVTGKSKTKVSKTKTNQLKANADNYVLIRLAGVKGESLPSETQLTKIYATGTGSGSGANLVWEVVTPE